MNEFNDTNEKKHLIHKNYIKFQSRVYSYAIFSQIPVSILNHESLKERRD